MLCDSDTVIFMIELNQDAVVCPMVSIIEVPLYLKHAGGMSLGLDHVGQRVGLDHITW